MLAIGTKVKFREVSEPPPLNQVWVPTGTPGEVTDTDEHIEEAS